MPRGCKSNFMELILCVKFVYQQTPVWVLVTLTPEVQTNNLHTISVNCLFLWLDSLSTDVPGLGMELDKSVRLSSAY